MKQLEEAGYSREAELVRDAVSRHRRILAFLEKAYTMGRYGGYPYTATDIEGAVSAVRQLIDLLEKVVRSVKVG